ncbi:P-loop containing nucleoside triphosphate hydrolase protein [Polychytrium aggregatum]|uniref:P-loop containing nucleoside triphosphate hydrolase protein n=1 Tax=Polychytrium aggregatum TaxID=110093 RepID=UPI0022FE2557|nr:P-loop containing nucleoside triphosphate hydrolase protein [Polychytrium aggregatum]KAI9206184.1 P-loop containing nucleoside triphosphate hydrolase protein [Polychytrium aggregatum]
MSEASIQSFLDDNSVTLMGTGEGIYRPIIKFAHAGFPKELSSELEAFPKPTCIQSIAWPGVLSGRDLVGIAATGSGKTIAFALPSMIHIRNRQVSSGSVFHGTKFPQVLVLSPTRELAIQIQETYEKFGGSIGIRSTCVYGGVNKWEQKKVLNNGVGVIVATPGRLIDLIEDEDGSCDLSDVSFLVLDEADRMLDLGFEEAIKKIVARIKPKSERQTVMFSATWPSAIQKIASQYLNEPIRVTVGSTDLAANVNIEQRVEVLDPQGKDRRLVDLLRDYHKSRKNRVLVFALYKKEAARLEQYLQRQGWKVASIHGDLSQQQRTDAITKFKDGSMPLLVATDVAARGIDVNDVEYVINYTYPLTTEEYCHRIGRTGRAGKKGIAHTFFTVQDKAHSGALINVLKQANQKVPAELMKFGTTVKKKADPNYGAFVKDVDMNAKGTKIVFGDDD